LNRGPHRDSELRDVKWTYCHILGVRGYSTVLRLIPREQVITSLASEDDLFGAKRLADAFLGPVRQMNCVGHTPGAVIQPKVVVWIIRAKADREDFVVHDAQFAIAHQEWRVSKKEERRGDAPRRSSPPVSRSTRFGHIQTATGSSKAPFQERLPGLSATRDALARQ